MQSYTQMAGVIPELRMALVTASLAWSLIPDIPHTPPISVSSTLYHDLDSRIRAAAEQSVATIININPLQASTSSGVKTLTSWLWVNKPSASILGSREKHVTLGASVTITCELRDTVRAPQYVFWYHNNTMINYRSVSAAILICV